jgi:ferredoxin-NADP reductase
VNIIFDSSDNLTKDIKTFWFKPDQPLKYTAGQFTELTLKHEQPDNRGEKRWFTLSSAPGNELVSVTTKYADDEHTSSFKRALFRLQPGHELLMSQPMGDFVLPKDTSIPLIFIAGGIGITPFHSMFSWLATQDDHRNIHLLYSVRNEEDIVFKELLASTNARTTVIVAEPSSAWHGERGHLTPQQIIEIAKPAPECLVYISGPEPMIQALTEGIQSHGVPKRQIVTDFFPGYLDQ